MKDFFNNTITLNVLFCVSYFLLATLGFQWGALTANATLLWPPSGLAAFACIVFGRRILPGLLLGAIISSQSISLANPLGNNLFSYLVASLSGSASILQAIVIAKVAQHYYAQRFRTDTIAAFHFTLRIVACCTIAATLCNFILWQANIISFGLALQNWAVWWMGDTIGVLIVNTLLMWLYHRYAFDKNPQANAFFIFCAGIGVVLLTVAAVGHNERENFQKNLLHETENIQSNMQANIDLAVRDLSTLQEYFLNNRPDQQAFRNLTEPLLKRNLSVDSFSWLPTITTEKYESLKIDMQSGIKLARMGTNRFDWQTPDDDIVVDQLKNKTTSSATHGQSDLFLSHIGLNQSSSANKLLIHMLAPLYVCEPNRPKSCYVRYIISNELNLDSLMSTVTNKNQLKNLDIRLRFEKSNEDVITWRWDKDHWTKAITGDENSLRSPTTLHGKIPHIDLLNSQWQLLISSKTLSMWFLPNFLQCCILTIGCALVCLLSAYLQALYRQDKLIIDNQLELQNEIHNQTEALRTANDWLLKEMEEKRATQEQLKASEAHMRTLLDNIPDPIWLKSTEGVYLSFNKAVSALFQTSEQEVVGKTASDYVDKDFDAVIKDFEKSVLLSHKALRRELWMHVPSKKENRLMDTIKVAMRDDKDVPLGILSIARDITEQHQLIDELGKFKRFAEYASEGFSIMTLSADTLYMNRSMQRILLSSQTLSHNHFFNYFPADLHELWKNDIFPNVLLNGYWQGELSVLRADKSRIPTKATFFIIRDDKGQPTYLGEIMSDISEQKQIEASLQLAKEAAEESTHAKSRFLANMSHEIRTPLNAILGYSQLLMIDPQLSSQQHERMQAILNAGQRLLHLINDILDLSKIEAGALHFRQDYFDLRQELNDIIALMRTKANTKGLALNYDIQLPTPAIVKSDRQKIGQIILNLLGNAIKFTHSGEVSLKVQHEKSTVSFTILDTGPGIAAQELQSLFAAFKQGKSGEESGGTGLGLVISKHIAESLGGSINLDSEQGKGTRAHLTLPLVIEHNTEISNAPLVENAKLVAGQECKVLVIEDDPASRDLLVNLLRNMGCTVSEAVNGKEGLIQALELKPHIIFTDIRMPELSGTEMLQQLRKTFTKAQLPVVAVSASSLEHERTFYLGQGFHEFIGKPYQFSDIYAALQTFVDIKFINSTNTSDDTHEPERLCWQSNAELLSLQDDLNLLKISLNNGDMNQSKKLFAQQSAQTLGKLGYQKIHNAIRQYDLVAAEQFLDEILAEITAALTAMTR